MENYRIAIIGLGYIGLPLAKAFSEHFPVVGFDNDKNRIEQLCGGIDHTSHMSEDELKSTSIRFTSEPKHLAECTIFIVAVPTGFDLKTGPDLMALNKANEMVAQVLKKNDLVIFESTVFPGCIESICAPALENVSGLKFNLDFFCGYSPERINPGDKNRSLTNIVKITSGSTESTADKVDLLYKKIIKAGTHKTPSIRVAEAAKVVENAQRFVNIAFINEMSLILREKNIDTLEVLSAAESKWNFLPFRPGLVGGDCLALAAAYLSHDSGPGEFNHRILSAATAVNNYIPLFIASRVLKLVRKNTQTLEPKILILGATFKENFPNIKNSQTPALYRELNDFGCSVSVYDPLADPDEFYSQYSISLSKKDVLSDLAKYDAIILTVAHHFFTKLPINRESFPRTVIYDAKGILPKSYSDERL